MARKRPSALRRLLSTLLLLTLVTSTLLVAAVAGALVWTSRFLHAPLDNDAVTLDIPYGATPARVVQLLRDQNAIADDLRWRLWPRLTGVGRCLQAGTHMLPPAQTPAQLAETLCIPVHERSVRLTIPEGWDKWKIADRVAELGITERDAFLHAVEDAELVARLDLPLDTAEGWLFPDTYQFIPDRTATDVVETLVRRAQQVHGEVFGETPPLPDLPGARNRTVAELVTLASIVEREAVVATEQPVIARVFYNRLATGMPLQSDPTCIYTPTRYNEVPTRADCRDPQSTHSTYVIPALPPTPIGNPGRGALQAVLSPSDDADLLYFVAMRDGTGRHAFARTLAEHNANVRRYLRGE